jgi:hypothetical protein
MAAPSGVSKVTSWEERISSSGAAVGLSGAKADSTGVIGIDVLACVGALEGMGVVAGIPDGAAAQAFKTKTVTKRNPG